MSNPITKRPLFIVVEGIDGSGKSSQVPVITDELDRLLGKSCLRLREPGSTELGEQLRQIMLGRDLAPQMQTSLMFAARQQMLLEHMPGAYARQQSIVCDRYVPSTVAYQGWGQGVRLPIIRAHYEILANSMPYFDVEPDLTIYFDLLPEQAAERMSKAAGEARGKDTFEKKGVDFFTQVRQGYLEMAANCQYSKRWEIIDASAPLENVSALAREIVRQYVLPRYI